MFLVALVHVLHVYILAFVKRLSLDKTILIRLLDKILLDLSCLLRFYKPYEILVLKYIHVERVLLFLTITLLYRLNIIQNVSHHSIANACAVLSALSK